MRGKNGTKAAILLTGTDQMVSINLLIPVLGYIAMNFPESASQLTLLITITSLVMVPTMLIVGKLCDYFDKKPLLIIGTIIFIASGLIQLITSANFTAFLVSRAIMGVGCGFLFTLPQAMIAQLYVNQERNSMMGVLAGFGSLFSLIASIIAGILGVFNWKLTFVFYALYVIVLIFQIVFIPSLPPERKILQEKAVKEEERGFDFRIVVLSAAGFLSFIVLNILPLNISVFIIGGNLGTSVQAGLASGTLTIVAFLISIFFAFFFKTFKRYTITIVFVLFAAAYFIMSRTHTLGPIFISEILIGMGTGLVGPFFSTRAATISPIKRRTMIITIVLTFFFLGQFAASGFQALINIIFGQELFSLFLGTAITSAVLAVISLLYMPLTEHIEKDNPPQEIDSGSEGNEAYQS